MAATGVADASFLVALLDRRDSYHSWAVATAAKHPPRWHTCEAVLSETFFLLGQEGKAALAALLKRDKVSVEFKFQDEREQVLALLKKYSSLPISLADACLVRMTETLPNPVVLTADSDFRIYRRHSRQPIPCALPR